MSKDQISEGDVHWVVNSLGELGVEIHGRYFFCYKGESFEYQSAVMDDGTPIRVRRVGKREFGETVWPVSWMEAGYSEDVYQVEVALPGVKGDQDDDDEWRWKDLPSTLTNTRLTDGT